jgi:hypothetical protein
MTIGVTNFSSSVRLLNEGQLKNYQPHPEKIVTTIINEDTEQVYSYKSIVYHLKSG